MDVGMLHLRLGYMALVVLSFLPFSSQAATPYDNVGARTAFNQTNSLSLAKYCNGSDTKDDSACIQAWINAGQAQRNHLYAPAGTYIVSRPIKLFNGIHMKCESNSATVFKNSNNVGTMFGMADKLGVTGEPYEDISIENCGFDMNGTTANFATTLFIGGGKDLAKNITIRGNKVFDSAQRGHMYVARDRQRQYFVILGVEDVLIENNTLSEGGRIKAGRPGSRIVIRNNSLHNINDNGITVVNLGSNAASHYLIENNTIVNALGSSIFFGADGQKQGTEDMSVTDITIRGNKMSGNQSNCIMGTLPNHAARIYVYGNECRKIGSTYGYEGRFDTGIAIIRNDTSTLPTIDVTIKNNSLIAEAGAWFENGGIFTKASIKNLCVVGNNVSNGTGTAILLHKSTTTGKLTGNNLNGGKLGLGVTIDQSSSTTGCFEPTHRH
jgi:hypothetical protein